MLTQTAIQVKDELYAKLRDNKTTLIGYCETATTVLTTLTLTAGLWESNSYSYKASEICDVIVSVLNDFKRIRENHAASVARITKLITQARELSDSFRKMQNDRMNNEAQPTSDRSSEYFHKHLTQL